ncbi:hypothetical protein F4779DRAFT_624651 [Xylariaceae sp. FL0662B]|nr:hypothetical protein F4779DRAFT_624651 [Xylariaceae sp. FL0662B]
MSPAKDLASTGRARRPPHKRASTITGFFSKILPSGRPEQGGTRRAEDTTGDAEPVDRPPGQATPAVDAEDPSRRRVRSWSPQKGGSKFVENLPQDVLYCGQGRDSDTSGRKSSPPPPPPPKALPRESGVLDVAGVRELLKNKEASRRNRRNLKDSGDWLGVQGADPYTGEFSILTPTDTLSSETTSLSTRSRLASLVRKRKAARLEYEQIRLLEEEEKEKAKKNKEQAKLDKIERVKEDLRSQAQFAKWSQHKRQWSSAAEPSLSPIAQSLSSVAMGSSENSRRLSSGPSADYCAPGHGKPATPVPNFSRPSRHSTRAQVIRSDSAELHSSEIVQPRRNGRHVNESSDTIIHNSPAEAEARHLSSIRSTTQPSAAPLNVGEPGVTRTNTQRTLGSQKGQKPFLWMRRRRATDPGELVRDRATGLITPAADTSLKSSSSRHLPAPDHFGDLSIPDYRLHLITPEAVDMRDNRSRYPDDFPLRSPERSYLGESTANLTPRTNIDRQWERSQHSNHRLNEATTVASQAKLKGVTRRPLTPLSLDPSLLTTTQTEDAREYHSSPGSSSKSSNHSLNDLSGETLGSQSGNQQPKYQESMTHKRKGHALRHIHSRIGPVQSESASIHTITTTGSDPDPPVLHHVMPLRTEINHLDGAMDTSDDPVTPTSSTRRESCIALALTQEGSTASSRPTTPQSGSARSVPVHETAENEISSVRLVTSEKKPTRVPTPTTPKLCRLVMVDAGTTDENKLEEAKFIIEAIPPKSTEVEEVSLQGTQAQAIDQTQQGTSPPRAPSRTHSQEAHQRLSPGEQKEVMIQEAARIAMSQSRAKAVIKRTKRAARPPSRGLSPANNNKRQLEQLPAADRPSTELMPSLLLSRKRTTTTPPAPGGHQDSADTGALSNGSNDAVATLARAGRTAYFVLLGLAYAWWLVARPAFDQRSPLWRRRHRQRSTWRDVVVFAAAGALCLAGALAGFWALRAVWWVGARVRRS